MASKRFRPFHSFSAYVQILMLLSLAGLLAMLASCGANVEFRSNPPVGSVRVTISDPPSCRFPPGSIKHVYISIRSVQAHVSNMATDNSPGWKELAMQLVASQPIQVDLLSLPQNGCTLATLGSNASLPVGDYQQIRLLLVSNTPGSNPVPASNACGSLGFNCVVLSDDSVQPLELSSQANTGLKIPPGQVMGGPIRVAESENVDINIDFNVCASLVPLPSGSFRLRPTLTAGQVSTTPSTAISGQVVDSATMQPINGTAHVALEQADSSGINRIVMQAVTDPAGNFSFCPMPTGMYDVVAVATGANNVAYNATIVLGVPQGVAVGKVPLIAESGATPAGPATIKGTVSASSGMPPATTGASVDVAMSAFQAIPLSGGAMRQITIPLQGSSTPNVATAAGMMCPMGTHCADYTLIVPASNPSFGTFSSSGTMFSTPAAGDVLFTVEARAFAPMSGGTSICSPSQLTTDKNSADMPLKVTGGMIATAKRLDFTGCM